jgi:hypothetical protein
MIFSILLIINIFRGRPDDALRLNSTPLRVTSEDFGHSTLPYVEVTGNFILSETGAAQTYYLPSYALWNSWWHWPLYLGTAG